MTATISTTDVVVKTSTEKTLRKCARIGCDNRVNKATAKYCCVKCCSLDPARNERLRQRAKKNGRRVVLPMSHQLKLPFFTWDESDLWTIASTREDVPVGMRRLTG